MAATTINDSRLYRGLDVRLPHKDSICKHLQKRYETMFGVEFEFMPYDVTSTYFEGKSEGNPKAQRGYSRYSRGGGENELTVKCVGAKLDH